MIENFKRKDFCLGQGSSVGRALARGIEVPGSNPGPGENFSFKISIYRRVSEYQIFFTNKPYSVRI